VILLSIVGLSDAQFLGIVIGVPIAAVIIIIVIVSLAVPSIRAKIFPYRDRKRHVMTKQ